MTKAIQDTKNKKLGIALVGLGYYATEQLAPALLSTEHCYLSGIVTGTDNKTSSWKENYNIPDQHIYSYDNFDDIKYNADIDIVYITLPNHLHAEYTIKAFEAGKHVICEKPMAITVSDCDKMIAASKKAGRHLSIGYRLQFDPYHLEIMRLGTGGIHGKIDAMKRGFGFIATPDQWRLKREYAGGGPLMDLGIYAIQGMCYMSGMEPIAVTAKEGNKTDLERFKEVEESISWQFEFANGVYGTGFSSYNEEINFLRAETAAGIIELSPAFNYSDLAGSSPSGKIHFPKVNQQALQMDAIALCIKKGIRSIVPGEMGKRDVHYLQAIYRAMETGERIVL